MLLGAGYDTISIYLAPNVASWFADFYKSYLKESYGKSYIKHHLFFLSANRLDTSYNMVNSRALRKIDKIYGKTFEYRYNRIDCYIDIDCDLSLLSRVFNYPHKRDKAVYANSGSFYKSRSVGLRIYDKKLQLGKKPSRDVHSGVYDSEHCWRIEFQIRLQPREWFTNDSLFERVANLYYPLQSLTTYKAAKTNRQSPYKILISQVLAHYGHKPLELILSLEKNSTRRKDLQNLLLESTKEYSLFNTIEEGLSQIKLLTNETDENIKYNHDRFLSISRKTYT